MTPTADSFWHRPQRLWWRKLLLQIHLWAGVITGLYIFVVSVSGAALVFREEMLTAAHNPLVSQTPGERIAFDTLYGKLNEAYPNHRVSWIRNRENPREAIEVWLDRDAKRTVLLADAVTGKILGPKTSAVETSLQWLAELHISLLAGQTGYFINGIGAGFLCLMCLTGAVVWWPGIKNWRRSLSLSGGKSWKRFNWDLHSAMGFWTFLFVVIWAVTGVYFTFPQPFRTVVNWIAPAPKSEAAQKTAAANTPAPPRNAKFFPIDSMVATAERATPGRVTSWIGLPFRKGQNAVQVYRRDPVDSEAPLHIVNLDPYTGQLKQVSDLGKLSPGDRILRWFSYLHIGNFGGVTIKIVWTIVGLAPAVLFVTGFLMWWNRVLSKRWKALRASPAVPVNS